MDRQDREALYMIVERNGFKYVELFLDRLRKEGWEAVVREEHQSIHERTRD